MSRGVAGRRRGSPGGGGGGDPNNSPIWPEPWTITPRDQISRSGSIPHFDSKPIEIQMKPKNTAYGIQKES